LDQGPTPGKASEFVSSNLIALFGLGVSGMASGIPRLERRAWKTLLFAGFACSVLRELFETIEVFIACQPAISTFHENSSEKPSFATGRPKQHKLSKHRSDPETGSWSLGSLIQMSKSSAKPSLQWLGFGTDGLGLDASRGSYCRGQTLGLRSGLPSSLQFVFTK
jgi:hypothetical protein